MKHTDTEILQWRYRPQCAHHPSLSHDDRTKAELLFKPLFAPVILKSRNADKKDYQRAHIRSLLCLRLRLLLTIRVLENCGQSGAEVDTNPILLAKGFFFLYGYEPMPRIFTWTLMQNGIRRRDLARESQDDFPSLWLLSVTYPTLARLRIRVSSPQGKTQDTFRLDNLRLAPS